MFFHKLLAIVQGRMKVITHSRYLLSTHLQAIPVIIYGHCLYTGIRVSIKGLIIFIDHFPIAIRGPSDLQIQVLRKVNSSERI